MKYPRSPHDKVNGLSYFGRMLDKIRLHHQGELPPDLLENLGIGFDKRCVNLLGVSYPDLAAEVTRGARDEEAFAWSFAHGRKPTEEDIYIWNEFMRKRGWKDEGTETLVSRKKESGLEDRSDIETMFDYIDADEGRAVKG